MCQQGGAKRGLLERLMISKLCAKPLCLCVCDLAHSPAISHTLRQGGAQPHGRK